MAELTPGFTHAAHVMIAARTDRQLFNSKNMNGFVIMQLRFDGHFGFPGGLLDPGESATEGLNRELQEEIGCDSDFVSDADFLYTSEFKPKNLKLHFYVKLVTEEELLSIEKRALEAHEHGHEALGHIRVPLYNLDYDRGFNTFIQHKLIGNAFQQLIVGLSKLNMSPAGFSQ